MLIQVNVQSCTKLQKNVKNNNNNNWKQNKDQQSANENDLYMS